MTTIDSDDFNRTVASGWGTSSGGSAWSDGGGAFTSSVNGTNGLTNETGTGFTGYKFISGASQQNPTISADCKSAGANSKIGVMACYLSASVNYDANFGGSGQCIIERNGVTVASGFTIASFVATNFYTVELLVNNGTIEARFWQAGGTRPTSPNLTYSDTSPLAAGSYGFIFVSSATGARTWSFDNFLATALGIAALSSTHAGVGTLSGSLSANTQLSNTHAGRGSLSAILSANTHLSSTHVGSGRLLSTLKAVTSLQSTIIGRGQFNSALTLSSVTLHTTFSGHGTFTSSFGGSLPEIQGNRPALGRQRKKHVG